MALKAASRRVQDLPAHRTARSGMPITQMLGKDMPLYPARDPLLSLAIGLDATPGAYALLLGSGLSSAAGIPTGDHIVLDLIRRLAAARGKGAEAHEDPKGWYRANFGKKPGYDQLLEDLAFTSTERMQLLRGYFEPTPDEREAGKKAPTAAHRAIARQMGQRHVRVVITTNFDRLLEDALRDVGVAPTVIYSPEMIAASLPHEHGPCIVKLHGDYLDARLRNTQDELSAYDPEFEQLLSRVLADYGLLICGWSAQWDTALRDALMRTVSRRFTTYWATRRPLEGLAGDVAAQRSAEILLIESADAFFQRLDEQVTAVGTLRPPDPLSPAAAAAVVKRYLPDDQARIRLDELVQEATEDVYVGLGEEPFKTPLDPFAATPDDLSTRLEQYLHLSEVLLAMAVPAGAWARQAQADIWALSIERLANVSLPPGGTKFWHLQQYPALLLQYAAGIAAVARENFAVLSSLLQRPQVHRGEFGRPMVRAVDTRHVLGPDFATRLLPGLATHRSPFSAFVEQTLREPLRPVLPSDQRFQEAFDRFEYLRALTYADMATEDPDTEKLPSARGCYLWRQGRPVWDAVARDIGPSESSSRLLQAGMFFGSKSRYTAAFTTLERERAASRDQ